MTVEEVLDIACAGAAAGCHEALFTLGDKPERRYRVAREELAALGFETTIDYLVHVASVVLDETGLLPHANPGVLTADELSALRRVSVSQGIMLESVSDRLSARGGPHFGSPDKHPAARLETLRLAGELAIPFTTGILIGIGETRDERLDALLAIRDLHDRYGHIQEVIVQNFRAKPDTKMADHPEPSLDELLWTAAAARLVLGPDYEHPGAAQPLVRRFSAPARCRNQRLGRGLAGHDRSRQSGGSLAGDRAPRTSDTRPWARSRASACSLPRVRAGGSSLVRATGGNRRRSARRMPPALPARTAGLPAPLSRLPPRSERPRGSRRTAALPFECPVAEALAKVDEGVELVESDVVALFEARDESLQAVLRRRRCATRRRSAGTRSATS